MISCCYAYDGSQDLTSFPSLSLSLLHFPASKIFRYTTNITRHPFELEKISTEHEFLYLFLYLLLRQLYPSLKLWFRAEAKEKKYKLNAYRHLNLSDANLK